MGRPEEKTPLGRQSVDGKDKIKTDFKHSGWRNMDWINP